MPFWLLYLVSDGVFVILFYVIRYRRHVVTKNLVNAFPEKTPEELKAISRAYYHYLCDLFLETFKTLTISKESMEKRCVMDRESLEYFKKLAAENESCIIVMGHQGNWEWGGNTFSLLGLHQLFVIYHPIRNPHFDGLMRRMRGRFGTKLIARDQTVREMIRNKTQLTATAFIADQSPPKENAFWMNFLNQDTAVFLGTEKLARKMNYPVVFISVARQGRQQYTIHAEQLPYSKDDPEGTLTVTHTRKLEEHIRRQPETWLWSHRRWKHRRPS